MTNSNLISPEYGQMWNFSFLIDAWIYTPCLSQPTRHHWHYCPVPPMSYKCASHIRRRHWWLWAGIPYASSYFNSRSFQFKTNGTIQDGSCYINTNQLHFDSLQDKFINNIQWCLYYFENKICLVPQNPGSTCTFLEPNKLLPKPWQSKKDHVTWS